MVASEAMVASKWPPSSKVTFGLTCLTHANTVTSITCVTMRLWPLNVSFKYGPLTFMALPQVKISFEFYSLGLFAPAYTAFSPNIILNSDNKG